MKSAFEMPKIDPKLIPALLAGGAGALAGGTLTAMSPERQGESRMKRRWRILRNALLLGGAGAGGTALLQKGIQNAVTEPLPANDVSPMQQKLHDLTSGGSGAAVTAGGTAMGLLRKIRGEERNAGAALYTDLAHPASDSFKADPKPGLKNWYIPTRQAHHRNHCSQGNANSFAHPGLICQPQKTLACT
jgi:hypothetical protein